MGELNWLSAAKLSRGFARKKFSPVEVAKACLAQIAKHDHAVNAMCRVEEKAALAQARRTAEAMAAIWGALSSTVNPDRRRELIERHGAALIKACNQHAALLEKLGLQGPYSG